MLGEDTMDKSESALALGAGFRGRIWRTKGSRFVARERLLTTHTISITTVTMLSVYVIISSVVLLAFSDQLNEINEKWLNVVNIGLSVLIIAFSLIEASRNHLGGAEVMNVSGLRLGEIYGSLSAKMESGNPTSADLNSMEASYANALRESRLNHSSLDFLIFKVQNWKEFEKEEWIKNPILRCIVYIFAILKNYLLYICALISFPVLSAIFGSKILSIM